MKTKAKIKPAMPDAKRTAGSLHRDCSAAPIPTILFHGEAVWMELTDRERSRTTAINVSDVLDAVVRLMRREARQNSRISDTDNT